MIEPLRSDVFGRFQFPFYPVRSVDFQGKAPLPAYEADSAHLAPDHCRLCMGPCTDPEDENGPVHRCNVVERVRAEGPVAVGAQVLRARLTALPDRWTRRDEAA